MQQLDTKKTVRFWSKIGIIYCAMLMCLGLTWGRFLEKKLGFYFPIVAVFGVFPVALIGFKIWKALQTHQLPKLRGSRALSVLCLLITLILVFTLHQRIQFKIEWIHLLKYGTLSFSIFYFIADKPLGSRLLKALLLAIIASSLEEGAQHFHPQRVFDLKDLVLNLISVLVGSFAALTVYFDCSRRSTKYP